MCTKKSRMAVVKNVQKHIKIRHPTMKDDTNIMPDCQFSLNKMCSWHAMLTLCNFNIVIIQGHTQGVMGCQKTPLSWGLVYLFNPHNNASLIAFVANLLKWICTVLQWCIVKHAFQNNQNDCHQWFSDSSRMHQIRFRSALCPRPCWQSLQRSPRSPSCLRGPYF